MGDKSRRVASMHWKTWSGYKYLAIRTDHRDCEIVRAIQVSNGM